MRHCIHSAVALDSAATSPLFPVAARLRSPQGKASFLKPRPFKRSPAVPAHGPHLEPPRVDWRAGPEDVPQDVSGAIWEWFNESEAWLGVLHDVPAAERQSFLGRGLGPQSSRVPLQTLWARGARRRSSPLTVSWMACQSLALRASRLVAGNLGHRGRGAAST